jgi:NADH-ubiquinone oxidoreductase chain 5
MNPARYAISDIEFIDWKIKILPLIVTLLGAFFAFYLYDQKINAFFELKKGKTYIKLNHFFNKKWYFDRIYNQFVAQKALNESYSFFYKTVDRGLIEKVGPFGIVGKINSVVDNVRNYQTGSITDYLEYFFIAIFIIVLFLTKALYTTVALLMVCYFCINFKNIVNGLKANLSIFIEKLTGQKKH